MIKHTNRLPDQRHADSPQETGRGDAETSAQREKTRRGLIDVFNGWDKAVDRAAERIGDSIVAGTREAWTVLWRGKKTPKNPEHTESSEHTAA